MHTDDLVARNSLGLLLAQRAAHLSDRASFLVKDAAQKLCPISRIPQVEAKGTPVITGQETLPEFFDTMRAIFDQIEEALNNLNDIVERVEF